MLRAPGQRTLRWLLLASAFLFTAAFRYLTLGEGFPNDHFVYITGGWQMLFGEWPTRDWVDPGLPLMFLASAAAQALFGPNLFAEAVLVSVAFGLAAALTAAAVLELTGSLPVALVATLLEVAVFPRTYGYPKVLVYAAAFLCFARYVSRPSMRRAVVMAVAVVVAFLFRHDHGIFLGIGGLATIALTPETGPPRTRVRHAAAYVAAGVLMVLPYVVYVQVNGGLGSYIRAGLEFSRREAARQWHVWPAVIGDPEPWASALVYEFHLIPVIALAMLAAVRAAPQFRVWVAQVVPVALVAVMVNYNFIRDPLNTRLPDAVVPAVILGAWVAARGLSASRYRRAALTATGLATAAFAASIAAAGDIAGNLNRTDLAVEWDHLPRLFAARSADLHARMAEKQIPTRATAGLQPFFAYLDRCTTEEHRLIVGGYLVELPFFARRRFAAGQAYFGGSFGGEEGERLALQRLRTQVVPFAVLPSDYASDFEARFSLIAEYVRSRYRPLAVVPITDELDVTILVDTALTPLRQDAGTGWPCFTP